MSNVPHEEYFACDPCECGGHPDCPVCGVETIIREREKQAERCPVCGQMDNCGDCNHYGTAHYQPEPATDEEIERSFDAYR